MAERPSRVKRLTGLTTRGIGFGIRVLSINSQTPRRNATRLVVSRGSLVACASPIDLDRTTNSPERRSVGARSAGTLQVRDKKFENGSVESTHKVPNSHYHTKHWPSSGRVARWTSTPARNFKDRPPHPTPTSRKAYGALCGIHRTRPKKVENSLRILETRVLFSRAPLRILHDDGHGCFAPRAVHDAFGAARTLWRNRCACATSAVLV